MEVWFLPNISDREVYSRCHFKTISLHELKEELKKKNVNFHPSDSYHMMTLKMRAKILEAGAEPDVLKQLEDEISASNKFQQKRKVYNCCLTGCTFKTGVHSLYVKHLKTLHSNTRHRMICKLKGCERDFTSVNLLEVHLKVSHYSRPSLVKLA